MIDQLIEEMRARVTEPRPTTLGVSDADLRPDTDRQVKVAIDTIAKKFSITDTEALMMIQERDRMSGHWFGWVDAAKAIIKELNDNAKL